MRASPTPPVIADAPATESRILKEPIIPVTVPNGPNNGEIVTVALRGSPYIFGNLLRLRPFGQQRLFS